MPQETIVKKLDMKPEEMEALLMQMLEYKAKGYHYTMIINELTVARNRLTEAGSNQLKKAIQNRRK